MRSTSMQSMVFQSIMPICLATALALTTGCGGAGGAVPDKVDASPVLSVGQTASIAPGASLHFDAVVGDSRCPTGVQCITAGDIVLAFTVNKGAATEAFQLGLSKAAATQGMSFKLLSVTPYPAAGSTIPVSQYKATLQVQSGAF